MDTSGEDRTLLEQVRSVIVKIAADILDISLEDLDPEKSFIMLGGDSIVAIDFIIKCRDAGIQVDMPELLTRESLAALVEDIAQRSAEDVIAKSAGLATWDGSTDLQVNPTTNGQAAETNSVRSFPLVHWADVALNDLDAELQKHTLALNSIEAIAPCSPVQESFFISQAINPDSYISNVSIRLRSDGISRPLAMQEIIDAWRNTVRLHSMLRTAFVESNDRPGKFDQLVFKENAILPWITTSATESSPDTVRPFATRQFRSPHRLHVHEINAEEVQLHLEISHALVDGHSAKILLNDFRRGFMQNTYPLEKPSLPYAVVAAQQQDALNTTDKSTGASYWNSYLSNANESHLPVVTSSPHLQDLTTAHTSIVLSERKLRNICGQLSITPANLFNVAWALALRRMTLQNTVTFSYITSGRNKAIDGIEKVVGPCVNTLPCCLVLAPETTIIDALCLARQDWQDAIPFQHIPVAELPVAESRSLKKLGNTVLSVEREATNSTHFANGISMAIESRTSATDFDLSANVRYNEERLDVNLEYWASRIAQRVAKGQLAGFRDAVTFLLERTEASIGDFPSLTTQDQTILSELNSRVPAPVERCVHDLVQEQMATQPAAPAISAWDGELAYGELENASRRFAFHLVDCGVGPEVMVGLCMDKSKWAVVAMLAILRAGGAVVPLGVQHPLTRIEGIVRDTAAPVILVDRGHEQRLAGLATYARLLAVDTYFESTAVASPVPMHEPCTSVRPEHVAWVIYTSGSTGTPKGVVLEHRALATSILAHGSSFGIRPYDRMSQFAAHTFDAAIQEIMTTLSFGACTCVPSEDDRVNRLTPFLSEARITITQLTPTVAALVQPQDTPTVRVLILIGEKLTWNVTDQWLGHANLINAYGPSECCIYSTSKKIQDSADSSNIGTALAGGTWVVDPANIGQLVPLGTPGELLLEGPLLARGYLNDTAKTAATFVTDPAFVKKLALSPGRRMYRTGDIVQQNLDGSLIYIGRHDTQIKIRGQRVEIGEIESQIARLLPETKHSCVSYSTLSAMGPVLVAIIEATSPKHDGSGADSPSFVTLDKDQQDNFTHVRDSLRQRFPRYMIPSVFLAISALPLNDNSKLDRRRITQLLESIPLDKWSKYTARSGEYQAPIGAAEEILCESWSSCFQLEQTHISRTDNFFDFGGDSIIAMKLVQQLQEHALRISVVDIFNHPTLSMMATRITEDIDESVKYVPFSLISHEEHTSVVASLLAGTEIIEEAEIFDVLPTTGFQSRIVSENMGAERRQLQYFAFDADGPCDTSALTLAISRLVERVESLRTGFVMLNGRRLFQAVYTQREPLVHIRFTDTDLDGFCQDLLEQDIFRPPSLTRPMFDAAIIVGREGRHRILFRISHALYDGTSLPRIWRELERAFVGHGASNLVTIGPYLHSLQSTTLPETEEYWRELLRGATIPSISGLAEPRVSRIGVVSSEPLRIPRSTGSGFTVAVAVKAAWGLVLGRHSSIRDVVFADIFTGRSAVHPLVADAIACCARAVPTRITYEADWALERLLSQIQQQQISSMRHERLEFDEIVQLCTNRSDSKEISQLVSMVNHQKMSKQDIALGNLSYQQAIVNPKITYATFDFGVSTVEKDDGSLAVEIAYAADRISSELARALFEQLRHVLGTILANHNCKISHLLQDKVD